MQLQSTTRCRLPFAAALTAATLAHLAGQFSSPRALLIAGGTLIDGSGAPPRRNAAILLDGGRIA